MQENIRTPAQLRKQEAQKVPLHPNPVFASYGFSSTFPDRFWSKVNYTDTCWEWTGCVNGCGYGSISSSKGIAILASRAAWILCNGAIPEGMQVLHRCDNPPCVNPAHLFLGTQKENISDMMAKNRQNRGERTGRHKLTELQVIELRSDYAGGMSRKALRHKYNTSQTNVFSIVHRQSWTHI